MVYGDKGKPLSVISAAEQAFYDRMMLDNLANTSIMDRFASINKALPQNNSTELVFEKWITLKESLLSANGNEAFSGKNASTTGIETLYNVAADEIDNFILAEGSSGTAGGEMKIVESRTTVFPFGKYMGYTEELETFHRRWRLEEASKQFGEVAGILIDGFYRDLFTNGAGHLIDISGDGTGSNSVVDAAFSTAMGRMTTLLKLCGAKPVKEMLSASAKYGTIPVDAGFVAVVHPVVAEAIENNNADFIPRRLYADGVTLMPNEVGTLKKVRIIENENAPIASDGAGAYNTDILVFGKDHTAHVPLRGKGRTKMIIKPIGGSGTNDPLDRNGTIGFKGWLGAKVLYPERLGKITAKVNF